MNPVRVGLRAVALVALSVFATLPLGAQSGQDAQTSFAAGIAHLQDGRPEQAVELLRRAVKLDSKRPDFHKALGVAYMGLKKYDDAIGEFRKTLEIAPYYSDVHNDLGDALMLSGKREEGKKEFLAAFNEPTNTLAAVSARNLGSAYFDEKNYNEALNWYRTSLQRNKAYPDACLGLADSLNAMGRPEEAIAYLETSVVDTGANPAVVVALGEAYYRAGRFGEARSRLQDAARKDPTGPSGRRAVEMLKTFPK